MNMESSQPIEQSQPFGARMQQGSLEPVSFTSKTVPFWCPICFEQELEVGQLNGTQVCACEQCRGFLIDSQSFASLVRNGRRGFQGADDQPKPMNVEELASTIACPTCQQTMYTHPYHGPGNVVINSCNTCQLNWLDAGELAKIIRAPGFRG